MEEQEKQLINFVWEDKPREKLTKFPKLYESMNYGNANKTFKFGYLYNLLVFVLAEDSEKYTIYSTVFDGSVMIPFGVVKKTEKNALQSIENIVNFNINFEED